MVVGTQVGAYRVLQQIGDGGMGSVWLAEHSMLGRRAAVKVLHPEFSANAAIVTRFFNEARAATAISDPGIVQIFDFGHHTDGSAYIVMELLEGEPLDKRLARRGPLAVEDALRLMRQVATSLAAAHARGIVHRDLKPENIFVVRDQEVAGGERAKILDFGIAKLVGDTTVKTQTSAVMGTPTYMAPEQCRGAGQVDQRADVYALGCVLHALVTGFPPFYAEGAGEVIAMHLREPPKPPSARRAGIPRDVDELVLRCLAKDPAQRFASAGELAAALGGLAGRVSMARMSAPAMETQPAYSVVAATPTTLSAMAGERSAATSRRSRWPFAAAGGVVIGAIVAVAVVASGGDDNRAPSATVAAPVPPPAPAPVPAVEPAPAKPDPSAALAAKMKAVLAAFVTWSQQHAGAGCPDIAALGVDGNDAWGHAMKMSCTDQPSDQIVGIVSAGPDGQFGTADDVGSWELGRDVTAAVHGARWVAAAPKHAPAPPAAPSVAHAKPKQPAAVPQDATAKKPTMPASHQPVQLDENGIPVTR
ncbi:MAG TPA: serine/threonine-protein kinase [Kofleriaceae bacterium]|nr:serine/threonine-protein kinase [Kofleriaceae bacterium]